MKAFLFSISTCRNTQKYKEQLEKKKVPFTLVMIDSITNENEIAEKFNLVVLPDIIRQNDDGTFQHIGLFEV